MISAPAPPCPCPSPAPSGTRPALPIGPDKPWLAPLAGYTDLPFRILCREQGAAVACTEMVSAKGLVLGQGRRSGATEALLATTPPPGETPAPSATGADNDAPLVVQLFGAEASFMAEAVKRLVDRGYAWFDVNMGCSVPKVVKSGAGAAMLRDPENALAVAKAMLAVTGPGRVGFKLRLGWQAGEETCLPLAQALQDAGAGWLTLHPRSARQSFTGRADWAAIAKLKQTVSLPVLASGDLFTPEDAVACLNQSGADGVMFARGAMSDPAIFRRFLNLLAGGENTPPSPEALYALITRHAALTRRYAPDRLNRQGLEAGLLKMRGVIPRYCKHISGARALRAKLVAVRDWDGLDALVREILEA